MRAFGGHSCRDRTAEFKALAERLAREVGLLIARLMSSPSAGRRVLSFCALQGGASTSGAQENGGAGVSCVPFFSPGSLVAGC